MESGAKLATVARGFFFVRLASCRGYDDSMVTPEMLEILRCPMDPKREAKLVVEDSRLVCSRCGLQFRIREGFPSLLIDEATLPDGCTSPNQLPCQRK
jgi:uncharacterized protein